MTRALPRSRSGWTSAALVFLMTAALSAGAFGEQAENPVYQSWAGFKKGASVTYKSVTEAQSVRTESRITYQLVEITPEKAVVEMTVTQGIGGKETTNPPFRLENRRTFTLPPGVKKEEFGKPQGVLAEGEETLKAAGREFKAKWIDSKSKVEAGDTFTRAWRSENVPGGLVKTINRTPATKSTSTMELIEVKTP